MSKSECESENIIDYVVSISHQSLRFALSQWPPTQLPRLESGPWNQTTILTWITIYIWLLMRSCSDIWRRIFVKRLPFPKKYHYRNKFFVCNFTFEGNFSPKHQAQQKDIKLSMSSRGCLYGSATNIKIRILKPGKKIPFIIKYVVSQRSSWQKTGST